VSWVVRSGGHTFELLAAKAGAGEGRRYVAVGFSRTENEMGDDHVVLCNAPNNSSELYWNIDGGVGPNGNPIKYALPVRNDTGVSLNALEAQSDFLYCSFERDVVVTFMTPQSPHENSTEVTWDFGPSNAYYVLLSTGGVNESGHAVRHDAAGRSGRAYEFS
jgi:hypothetical protein